MFVHFICVFGRCADSLRFWFYLDELAAIRIVNFYGDAHVLMYPLYISNRSFAYYL